MWYINEDESTVTYTFEELKKVVDNESENFPDSPSFEACTLSSIKEGETVELDFNNQSFKIL